MSFDNDGLNYTLEASADLSASQFRGVVVAAGGIAVAGVNANITGVLQDNPDAVGQAANVRSKGVSKARAGGVIARGARVGTDASGDFVTGGATLVGTALSAASGAGSIFSVLLD